MNKAIIIVLDSLPIGSVGCYGNEWIATPALDQLAHGGFAFDFCFPEEPKLGAWLRQGLANKDPLETVDEKEAFSESPLLAHLASAGVGAAWFGDDADLASAAMAWGFDLVGESTGTDDCPWEEIGAGALDWLREQGDSPSFLWLQLNFAGGAWLPPPDFHERYIEEEEAPIDLPLAQVADLPAEQLSSLRGTVAGRVAYFDQWFGAFRSAVAEIAGSENCLWIVTADQGFPLGEHGILGTGEPTLYEERTHVPLVLSDPRGRTTCRSPALIQPIDLSPTLADFFELSCDEASYHGLSFLPTVRGESGMLREYACLGLDDQMYAIRTHNWKLILPVVPRSEEDTLQPELFVKPEDRWDTADVAEHHPLIADRLELQLRRHLEAARRGTLEWIKPLLPTQLITDE